MAVPPPRHAPSRRPRRLPPGRSIVEARADGGSSPVRLSVGRRAWHALRFGGLVLATLLAAHDAIYLLRFGVGDAFATGMAETGHGYWGTFTAVGLGAGALLLVVSLATLAQLRRTPATPVAGVWVGGVSVGADSTTAGRPVPAPPSPAATLGDGGSYASELARLWPRLLIAVVAAFLGQEVLEHVLAFGHVPTAEELASVLGPVSLLALAAVTFVAAAAGAAIRWQVRRLLALRTRGAGRRRFARNVVARPSWAIASALHRRGLLLVRLDAGRAPPVLLGR